MSRAQLLFKLVAGLAVVSMLLGIGLKLTVKQLIDSLHDTGFVLKAVVANLIVVPVLVLALVLAFRLPSGIASGMLLLSFVPFAPFAPVLAASSNADVALNVSMMAFFAVFAAFSTPLLCKLLLPLVSGGAEATVGVGDVLVTLVRSIIVPFGIGLAVHRWKPQSAVKLAAFFDKVSKILFAVIVMAIFVYGSGVFKELGLAGFGAMLSAAVLSVAIGYWMGGPRTAARRSMALGTVMRNTSVALLVSAGPQFSGTGAVPAVMVFFLVSLFVALAAVRLFVRQDKSQGGRALGRPVTTH